MPPKTATSARKRAAKPVAEPAPKPQPKAEKPLPPPLNAQSLAGVDGAVLARNLMEAGFRGAKLLGSAARRASEDGFKGPLDPLNISGAMLSLAKAVARDPATAVAAQMQLWKDWGGLWQKTATRMLGGEAQAVITPEQGDRRFRDPDWQRSAGFAFIQQSYLLAAQATAKMVGELENIPEDERARVSFYTRQMLDAAAPSNFVLTNPEVMRATLASNGENLVKGLDNLLDDVERGKGIRQTADGFQVGENIATAPGKVVFRNKLIELLQFDPVTEKVYQRPLLIFPPWINKYYIMDLRAENSFIRWLTAQGYTVFVVSWANPDEKLAEMGFEDYMRDGIFAALDAVKDATGVSDPNCVGYCIGGTLLAATLAYMAAKKDTRVHSATFWAAQTDFSQAGELLVFVDEPQLAAMEKQMDESGGVLKGSKMAGAFNMLRANDLIWSFVINNYLLGKTPLPFDLLHWNSDTTRMPKKLHLSYLRQCYRDNALALGKMKMDGVTLDLTKVKVPVYLQAAREDHISPAASVFKGTKLFQGPVRFVMAGSGHIAGVINPPAAGKYQYWTNDANAPDVEAWKKNATEHPGSWWTDWDKWLAKLSGPKIAARKPGDGKLKILGDAPGDYVRVKAG